MTVTTPYDMAGMTVSTTGTGTITLNAAAPGYQTFTAAGVPDGATVSYGITDANGAFEVGRGTYTASGTTLTRGPVFSSGVSNAAISLTAAAVVYITTLAEDLNNFITKNVGGTISAGPLLTVIDSTSAASVPVAAAVSGTALQVVGADGGKSGLQVLSFGTVGFPQFAMQAAAGTRASPTSIVSSQNIGSFTFGGLQNGSTWSNKRGEILFLATENWGTSNTGTEMEIVVSNTGTTTQSTYTFKDGNLTIPGNTLTVGGNEVALVPAAGLVSSNGTILEDTTIVGGTWSAGTLTMTGVSSGFLLAVAGANSGLVNGGLH